MILITIYLNRSIAIKEKEMIMKYRKDRYGNEISALGFGCMRFTGKLGRTDKEKAEKEIMAALEAGVNYFDTAYLYPGSEALIGEVFEKNGVRDKIKIATKLPHYMVKKYEDFDKFFNEQLKRLRTDHVEYYLMHMINDADSWRRLVDLGIESWIEEKKAAGKLQQIGFSYHGNADAFKELIDAYDWDFCQIQYNYLDETSQAGRTGFEYAVSKGIPVVIMEPLRGGKLAVKLPKQAMQKFDAYNKQHNTRMTPAAWGLSWLWDQPGVTCVLSGMNSLDMIIDNVRTAGKAEPECFGEEEKQLIADVKEIIESKQKSPAQAADTACRARREWIFPAYFQLITTDTSTDGSRRKRNTLCVRPCAGTIPPLTTALDAAPASSTALSISKYVMNSKLPAKNWKASRTKLPKK